MKSEEKAAVEPPGKKQKTAEGTVIRHVMQCVILLDMQSNLSNMDTKGTEQNFVHIRGVHFGEVFMMMSLLSLH